MYFLSINKKFRHKGRNFYVYFGLFLLLILFLLAFFGFELLAEGAGYPYAGGVHALGDRLAERVAFLFFGLGGLIELDDARAVKALAERNRHGEQKDSDAAVDKVARKHCKECQEWVHTDAVANDLRLDDLADDAKHGPKDEKSDSDAYVADNEADYRPRNYDKSRADNGENVKNCDQRGDQRGILHADYRKPREDLGKCDEHNERIGKNVLLEHLSEMRADVVKQLVGLVGELFFDESEDRFKVNQQKDGGNDHDDDVEQEGGHAHREARQLADKLTRKAHNGASDARNERICRVVEVKRHFGVEIVKHLLDLVKEGDKEGAYLILEERGQIRCLVCGERKYFNEQPDDDNAYGAVKQHNENDRKNSRAQLQLVVQKAHNGAKYHRNDKGDEEGEELGQRISDKNERKRENESEKRKIDQKFFSSSEFDILPGKTGEWY